MEKIVQQTLLFDFYGELLTEHQQRIYEDVVCNDMSYSEMAEQEGVSRQGIHDLIRRCNRQLEEYEAKLHLVEKFLDVREKVDRMRRILQSSSSPASMETGEVRELLQITDEILEEL